MLEIELTGSWRELGRLGGNGKADRESLAHEAAEGNEDNTETWTEGHTCHMSAENLAMCFAVRVLEVWRPNSKLIN